MLLEEEITRNFADIFIRKLDDYMDLSDKSFGKYEFESEGGY
ncbi:hypothetical protein SAMN04487886_11925 [Clostridium sp. DSM 8431]|nr:hypothetical protein [Clostridium sp. DSM 8431]SFU82359.1 hypothetical protein SAMN04487886_11925 [Clostridium sp. DSM 8431]